MKGLKEVRYLFPFIIYIQSIIGDYKQEEILS